MSLKKWAYLAEIGSAIAVVASLIYVGYELNQNTSAVRASNWQAVLEYAYAPQLVVLQNADVANILIKSRSTYDGLTEEERLRFDMYAQNSFHVWQAAYLYHQQGLLEDGAWESVDVGMRSFLEYPEDGHRGFWEGFRYIYDSG